MARPIAKYMADGRRFVAGKDAVYLRAYIGRHVIRILTANERLIKLEEEPVLSKSVKEALRLLRGLVTAEE